MKYLLDTNVISEIRKRNSNPRVLSYMRNIPIEDLFLSVVCIGEIAKGIEKLPLGKKKEELAYWLDSAVPEQFADCILPLDSECMQEWGRMCAKSKRTLPVLDSLIAATALVHRLILLTRNISDFEDIPGLSCISPWNGKH
ncbi:type II toxin-antitoxin system VapC family toxin [Leadbettera azotonutricia]|uniref:Plasmid stability protein n=1 Tax=Leadbettera azotonutricia (strain ATCC BAA-888 / DSM 13862 / ZAS-9) TaxID=545695 RepID=F5YAN8_LEAAZ|nr:type II toxin-antitoxin system VapC family toxin [Leadbettera azotonutricia]AEF80081.1 plasmid stability protein [Leadbettera azotonutricia ZAS-9]